MTDFNEQDIERLSAYLDGMLPEAERLEVEALLQSADSPYQAELASLENTIKLVKGLPTLKAPRSFVLTREMVGLPSTEAKRPIRAKLINFYAMSFLSAAASFIMVILAVVMWTSSTSQPQSGLNDTVAAVPTVIHQPTLEQPIIPSSAVETTVEETTASIGDSGALLGSIIGQTALSEVSAEAVGIVEEMAELPPLEAETFIIPPPISVPDSAVGSANVTMDAQAPSSGDETETEQSVQRMMAQPPSEDAIASDAIESETAEIASEEEETDDRLVDADGTPSAEADETAIEATDTDTPADDEPTATESAGLPASAVIFLVLGGLFALMAITGIYWARKVRA